MAKNIPVMKKIVLISVIIALHSIQLFSQKKEIKKGGKAFNKQEYTEAIDYYESALSQGGELDSDSKENLANSYFYLSDYGSSRQHFYELDVNDLSTEGCMNFGILYQRSGNYDRALFLFNKSLEKGIKDPSIHLYISSCKWAADYTGKSDYSVKPSGLNINSPSFGVQYYKDGIVYSKKQDGDGKDEKGMNLTDLYYTIVLDDGFGATTNFSKSLNSDYHDGGIAFSFDYKTIYFTNFINDRKGRRQMIYTAEFREGTWKNQEEMFFNAKKYSCAYPAMAPNGLAIYFASDMPGGYGGMDLYVIKRSGDKWEKPLNLGPKINTPADEVFPFMSETGELYFASDGHRGFGGLDIFYAIGEGTEWLNVTNMKQPVNSPKDDFAFVLDPLSENSKGFISTNRDTDGKTDALFMVKLDAISGDALSEFLEGNNNTMQEDDTNEDTTNETETPNDDEMVGLSEFLESEETESDEDELSEFLSGAEAQPDTGSDASEGQTMSLSDALKDVRGKDAITYRVQFKSSRQPIEKFKEIESRFRDIVYEYEYKGLYRYTIGEFYDPEPAIEMKKEVQALGYDDAFVAAFRGEKRVLDVVIYKDK